MFMAGWILMGGVLASAAEGRSVTRTIRADRAWTDTGVSVQRGRTLHLEAEGSAQMIGLHLRDWFFGLTADRTVGPSGTYVWPRRDTTHRPFPLPTMREGPFPAFCLIGKIGEQGQPFYVGARYDGTAPDTGRLWLGVNDDEVRDNHGAFQVSIELATAPAQPPHPAKEDITPHERRGRPIPHARVLLLYVDGLRADVVREMAEGGYLPTITQVFLDGGVEVPNAFSVFPSNTLIANGSLFTGLFSDRTGIKSQNQFERSTLKPRGQLSAWLPDGFIPKPPTRVLNLLDKYAPENTHEFLIKRKIPTLGSRMGQAFKFTTLPIAPLNPPPLWFHRAINTIGPWNMTERLSGRLDAVNAQYAIEELVGDPDARVIAVWLPMLDKTCHHSPRGQFGAARRDLALVDRWIGRILRRLKEVGWDRSTYLILVSDHGHLGGEDAVNRPCNIARDWAYQQLGCNVKVVGHEWLHPGLDANRFLFFDTQGSGQAKLFLPAGSYVSGPWRRNRFFELTHYDVRPGQRAVNLLESLTAFRPAAWEDGSSRPIDVILVKLDPQRTLVYRDDETQAIIHREHDPDGHERYRYEPIRRLRQLADGAFQSESPRPGQDPFGYLHDLRVLTSGSPSDWMAMPHTATEWLLASAQTRYPDAVVAIAKFFAWQPPVDDLAEVRDPDLVLTASAGWSFRSDDGEGTDHGYPLAESMRITLCLAGPHIAPGILQEPRRIVDILPTILEMIGWRYDPTQLDGEAIGGIYE